MPRVEAKRLWQKATEAIEADILNGGGQLKTGGN